MPLDTRQDRVAAEDLKPVSSFRLYSFQTSCQAAWCEESFKTSVKNNGLYEASGLALWLRTGVHSMASGRDVDPGDISFESLATFSKNFFSKDAAINAATRRGQAKKQKQKSRLLWPTTMVVGIETLAQGEKYAGDGVLNFAGGHFVLWAWYLALWEALRSSDA